MEEAVKTKGKGSNDQPQTLNVSPTALVFSATAGSGNPPSQAFSVSKSGGGQLSWTASENAAWLALSSSSGGNNQTISVSVNTSGLSAGTYSTPVTVSASGASNSPQTILVSLTVNAAQPTAPAPQPKIGLSPSSLAFNATQGGANPANQTVAVTNTGTGTLTWTVADNANWLTATQSGGSIVAGVNVAGLAAGSYHAAITVSASGATNTPQTIPVSLTVAAAPVASPTIAVSPSSFALTAQAGSTTVLNQTLTITNTGGGTFNWTVIDDSTWVVKNVGSGSGNGTVAISVNPTGLSAGTHTSLITVSATGATNTPQVVPVTLTLTAPPAQPTIGLSSTSLAFSGTAGGSNPASKSITVTNTGTGTLSWTVADNANWLTVTQAGSTITAAVNLAGLAAGTYNGVITVSATGATNTPQSVPVSLTVSAPTATPTIGLSPTSLAFSGTQGGANPANQTVAVTNTGTGTLTWTVADNANWLTATQSGGSIVAGVNVTGLTAGTYNAAITVSASGATNTPQTIPVSLTVAAAPVASPTIAVSPSSIALTAQAGSTTVLNQTLTITNTGGGTFNWTVIDDSTWVVKNVGSGSGNGTVAISVNPTGLSAGTHTSLITVSATGATNTPQVVPVTLTLTAPPAQPTIGLSSTSLAFSGTAGGSNPASKSITVTNTGTGTLSWTVADNANWLTVTQAGSTITAAVNLAGLAAGTYNGVITVSATGATNTPQSVPVTLTVSASGSTTGSVTLTWNANGEQDLGGYKVYRATSSGAYGAPIATINGNVTSYVASGLPKGTTYFFVVTAFDNSGNESSYSNEVSKSLY